jgi:DNA-binding beta-propeller fold protein YncE
VLKLDLRLLKVTRRLNVGSQPREVLADGGSVWVTNQGSGTLSRIR